MTIVLRILRILFFLFVAVPATAQTEAVDASSDASLLSLFTSLMYDTDHGYPASDIILARSFAAHLHGSERNLSVSELSELYAGYDPQSGSGATTGMLYFHLALPIALLREMGGTSSDIMASVMEYRLYWLAGDASRALDLALHLIGQMEELGIDDKRMASVLADAAVLSWRAGQVIEAEQFMARAQTCGTPRCPQDLIFEWLGEKRWLRRNRMVDYDIDRLLEQALTDAEIIWPGDINVENDIHQEALLVSDQSGDVMTKVIADLLAVSNPDDLTIAERRKFGRLAKRMVGADGSVAFAMKSSSVASKVKDFTSDDGRLELNEHRGLSYYNNHGRVPQIFLRALPLVHGLLQYSGQRDDALIADVIKARLVLAIGDYAGANLILQDLIGQAREQGYSDAELHSALMDLWIAASLSEDTDTAAQAEQDTLACRLTKCSEDLVASFFDRASRLPHMQRPSKLSELLIDVADPFIRKNFPDNMLALADMYVGVGGSERPIDFARYAGLSFRFAEQAKDISAVEFQKRATVAMRAMIYAGQYRNAADVGDRAIVRISSLEQTAVLNATFYRTRARAAFRMGDSAAQGFYALAVDRVIGDKLESRDWEVPEALALDLLDTKYLDLLDRLLSGRRGNYGVRARLRYKQGRYQEAADILQALRRGYEIYGEAVPELMEAYFEGHKEIHLRARNLDAYVVAQLAYLGVSSRENVPADHHLSYNEIPIMHGLAFQEAKYREAANDPERAGYLRALGGDVTWSQPWEPLGQTRDPVTIAEWELRIQNSWNTYSLIRDVIELRDNGNYDGAAQWMRQFRGLAVVAEANGTYSDAQTLWQMAFTFARVGEADTAFDLMNRAARIAANLSFEGAGGADGGTLQLLERDRWRYLLFVDIAWAAVSGQSPDEMLVVSRY